MELHRVTPDPLEDYHYRESGKFLGDVSRDFRVDVGCFDDEIPRKAVVANFPRFGGGEHRKSDFEVWIEWEDVKQILEKFCEAGNSEAHAVREATKLAAAAQALGWQAPQTAPPQSN